LFSSAWPKWMAPNPWGNSPAPLSGPKEGREIQSRWMRTELSSQAEPAEGREGLPLPAFASVGVLNRWEDFSSVPPADRAAEATLLLLGAFHPKREPARPVPTCFSHRLAWISHRFRTPTDGDQMPRRAVNRCRGPAFFPEAARQRRKRTLLHTPMSGVLESV